MLDSRKKYLQIAFNRSLEEIAAMIYSLPVSDRIIIEAGYPLVKNYGMEAIRTIKVLWTQKVLGLSVGASKFAKARSLRLQKFNLAPLGSILKSSLEAKFKLGGRATLGRQDAVFNPYIVADLKCMDRAFTEVEAASRSGASAVTCLGLAPVETIDLFIKRCKELKIDSMLDMMKVEYPFEVLSSLKKPPRIVMFHRGADEGEMNREKEMPFHDIARIKDVYDDVFVAVAGGESVREAVSGAFNDADIIVVWKLFNENPEKVAALTDEFLAEVK